MHAVDIFMLYFKQYWFHGESIKDFIYIYIGFILTGEFSTHTHAPLGSPPYASPASAGESVVVPTTQVDQLKSRTAHRV